MILKLIASPGVSIYHLNKNIQNPGLNRLIGDYNQGLLVHRNLLKSLNHLPLMQLKDKIATELELVNQDPKSFGKKYDILKQHQNRTIDTTTAIKRLIAKMDNPISYHSFHDYLLAYAKLGHAELHPSDNCNLSCKGCTYGHDDSDYKPEALSFPFTEIRRLKPFAPQAFTLVGGGEPTLYKSGSYGFPDMVIRLKELFPETKLGLITNGTTIPSGDWHKYISWIRISVDAANPATYQRVRGKDRFNQVIDNFIKYLEISDKKIGLSFLYSKMNIDDYIPFAKFIYEKLAKDSPQFIPRVFIHYRPLRQNPNDSDRIFPAGIDKHDIEITQKKLLLEASLNTGLQTFLTQQTNVEAFMGGNSQPPQKFDRCHYSQIFRIFRASGSVRPCFVRVVEDEFDLGNLLTDKVETISLNSLFIGTLIDKYCSPEGCRQSHVNHILEGGLTGQISPSAQPLVKADPFF